MRLDDLHLWYLGDPNSPRYVGALRLISTGKGVSLRYHEKRLRAGFALSEDLPLIDTEHLPPGRLASDGERARLREPGLRRARFFFFCDRPDGGRADEGD